MDGVVFKARQWRCTLTSWTTLLFIFLKFFLIFLFVCWFAQGLASPTMGHWPMVNGNSGTTKHSSFPPPTWLQWPHQHGTFFHPFKLDWEPGGSLLLLLCVVAETLSTQDLQSCHVGWKESKGGSGDRGIWPPILLLLGCEKVWGASQAEVKQRNPAACQETSQCLILHQHFIRGWQPAAA